MEIEKITVLGGNGKNGEAEPVREVHFEMGKVVSIVGPTGSGKTALINDIELFANYNTPTNRKTLINGSNPPDEYIYDPSKNPIALITQQTNFLSDLPVKKFLEIHARIRQSGNTNSIVEETIDFANKLTGESILTEYGMTELSGGQTRALLIADAVIIGNSPILLLDEIENAGIHRTTAIELLKKYRKIFIFVTHDPRIALLSDFRIVMKGGAMQKVIVTSKEEQRVAVEIKKIDDLMLYFRKHIRSGDTLSEKDLNDRLIELGYLSLEGKEE
jgi:ABC-type lipoprotein export system ATPase subunit